MSGAPQPSPATLLTFSRDYVEFNEGPVLTNSCIALSVVSAVTVAIRFAVRWRSAIGLGWDDWLILFSLPHLFSFAAMAILSVEYGGVGRHLPVVMALDPQMFARTMLYLFVSEFNYFTLIAVIKASILVMYCRIFPTRFMKKSSYIIGIIVGLWWFSTILATLFQCQPVQRAYNPFMQEGSCFNISRLFVGNSIVNIITDIMIIVLPAHEVWQLHLPRAQKLAIGGVFVLGFLAVVMTCIRLKSLLDLLGGQADFTQFVAPAWIWTLAEPTCGIVTASLPTMRPLLRFVFGMTFGVGKAGGGGGGGGGGGNNKNAHPQPGAKSPPHSNDTVVTIGGGSFSHRRGIWGSKPFNNKKTKQQPTGTAKVTDDDAENKSYPASTFDKFHDLEKGRWPEYPPNTWPLPGDLVDVPRRPVVISDRRQVQVMISGNSEDSLTPSDEIPLQGISVKRDIWTETEQGR
ncbi:hypothetical protein B0H63DRAFT_565578 [Podospora didyma]|uniref:Rhodopsin domain-containing protein n=1 Tax=Podospora didyma TaxID=330526 RepID=A0AAE0N336_9PEZI|nr:hypothetical protein B0H63DRAFT_565578 [Podospora didyma]